MRIVFVILLAGAFCGTANAVEWLTITGDKNDPGVDTTQLDISTYRRFAAGMVIRLRVNLAEARNSSSGEIYHSYISNIVIECPDSIRHQDQARYRDTFWTGPVQFEKFAQPKPMAFGGLQSEPKKKILLVACAPKRRDLGR
jgi:hypothetical protein